MKNKTNNSIKKLLAGAFLAATLFSATSQPANAQATHTTRDWAQSAGYLDNGDSLRNYQTRLRSALFQLKDHPEQNQPLKLSARVVAEGRTGVRRLRIRNFQFLSDGSPGTGEYNLGAGSWPSVVGVLGSAVAQDFLIQATIKGIPIDELEVVFTSRPAPATSVGGGQVTYPQNLVYTAYIVSPASDAELEDLRQTVERVSPVLNVVSQKQEIDHGQLFYTQTPKDRTNTLPGLRDFLEGKRLASQISRQARADGTPRGERRGRRGNEAGNAAQPVNASAPVRNTDPPLRAHIKVEGGTGIRHVRTDTSNFQFIHDTPRYLAGHNLGPVAEEHILGVMITCLTHIYEIQAANRNVALDSLELEVEGTLTPRVGSINTPPRYSNINYKVHIGSPESKETIEELQKAVEAACPIYNMLKNSQEVKGSIVRGLYQEPLRTASAE